MHCLHGQFSFIWESLDDIQVDCLFGEADVNGDGQVTVEEFRRLLSECHCRYPQIAAYFSQSWDENIEKYVH